MKAGRIIVLCLVALSVLSANAQQSGVTATYVPVTKYDPKRDADGDVKAALAEAKRTSKRVLLEVGGEWCSWCHAMDRFFDQHTELLELRERNFITVKINFSPQNENKRLLSRYPSIPGYPHLFVLDENGKVLRSQDTSKLELGKSYDLERFMSFLKQWSPRPQ